VSPAATTLATRWRGAATGALTATLSLVAHTAGGGALPSGSGAALLAVMALTLGALAATMPGAATTPGLFLLLASGQVLGHLLLETAGHQHAASSPPSTVMVVAHVAAVFVGATVIAAAARLADALSRVVHAVTASVQPPVWARPVGAVRSADQPLRSALALGTSVSHRGPPVGRTR
jgi:hypothetical protein